MAGESLASTYAYTGLLLVGVAYRAVTDKEDRQPIQQHYTAYKVSRESPK